MKTAREAGQRKRCCNNGDERNVAVHNKIVQLQNSYREPQANGSQPWSLGSIFCSSPWVVIFLFLPFFWMPPSVSLSPLWSHHPSPSVLSCGSLTRRIKCVFAVVYRQDVTAVRSNPICFQIRGPQRTKRQGKKINSYTCLLLNTHFCLVVHKTQKFNTWAMSLTHTITNKTSTNPPNTQLNRSELFTVSGSCHPSY